MATHDLGDTVTCETLAIAVALLFTFVALEARGQHPIPMTTGALLAATGMFWLSAVTVQANYVTDVLGPLVVLSIGLGMFIPRVTSRPMPMIDVYAATGTFAAKKALTKARPRP